MTSTPETETAPTSLRTVLRRWFGPPRAHGEVDDHRVVSFLELFYDLVFVVLIAQIAHALAADVSWSGVRDFAVVFSLVWLAWLNGTLYHELHGREDGRSRLFMFAQMGLLVLLSVYAGHAASDSSDGRGFAVVYVLLLALLGAQWFGVRRYDTPEMAALVLRYVLGVALTMSLVGASVLVDDQDVRLALWIAAVTFAVVGFVVQMLNPTAGMDEALRVTESMAERFGLFTIIVLGEVVVGVADGLAEADRSTRTIVSGLLGLGIGFGFWWNYFDFVGRRTPRAGRENRTSWLVVHLPLAGSIAAAGAAMVSVVEHAADARTPAPTSWLLAGTTAAMALSLAVLVSIMPRHPGRRAVPYTLAATAVLALVVGGLRPAPWLLALVLFAALCAVWIEVFVRQARTGHLVTET